MKRRYYFIPLSVVIALALPAWNTVAQEPEGLVLYLPFEEADNPVDHSPDPAEVSITGELRHVDGKIGKALEFDGDSANIVEVTHADKLEDMEALTIEAWVMPVEPDSKEGMSVVSKRAAWEQGDVYNLFIWTGQTVRARVNAQGEIISSTVLEDGEWYHLAYIFDSGAPDNEKVRLYINGELEASGTHPDQAVNEGGAPLWIGELDPNRGFGWKGIIDEVGIWNRPLGEDEISAAMEGRLKTVPVEPGAKLSATWGEIKEKALR